MLRQQSYAGGEERLRRRRAFLRRQATKARDTKPSCCFPRATAPRSRAAKTQRPDRERALDSHCAQLRTRDWIPAEAGGRVAFRHPSGNPRKRAPLRRGRVHTRLPGRRKRAGVVSTRFRRDYPCRFTARACRCSADGLGPRAPRGVGRLVERIEPGLSRASFLQRRAGNYLADLLPRLYRRGARDSLPERRAVSGI